MYLGIDIFSGAGGMSIGAEHAGISISVAIEKDIHAAATFKYNHPNAKVIVEDICKVDPSTNFEVSPFVLFGGPPCQGFSFSNTKSRNMGNPNNKLFEEYLRFVEILNPSWIVFENVEGFNAFEGGVVVSSLEERLHKLGYKINKKVLCASDYGVPQNRNRFFLIANRLGIDYQFPKHVSYKVSVAEALEDLPVLNNGDKYDELDYKCDATNLYAKNMRKESLSSKQNYVSKNEDYVIERYKHIKQGQNWKAIPAHLMSNYKQITNTHSGIYKRLDPNLPSVVISNYRKNMLIHPFEHRGLSVREAARLQSFPDNFIFKGSLMHIQQQIGNAVPPLLAYSIFKSIIYQTEVSNNISTCSTDGISLLAV